VSYDFYTEKSSDYDIRVRVAANASSKKMKLVIVPDHGHSIEKVFTVPNKGWHGFSDLVWGDVHLEKGHYSLEVYFLTGKVNLCSATVLYSGHQRSNPAPAKPTLLPHPAPTQKPVAKPTPLRAKPTPLPYPLPTNKPEE
jgi:hypothetical protein